MIIAKIREFLETDPEFASRTSKDLKEEESLFEKGILDSFGVMYLISFLESNFNIKISPEDLEEKNFSSLKNIEEFINHKKLN